MISALASVTATAALALAPGVPGLADPVRPAVIARPDYVVSVRLARRLRPGEPDSVTLVVRNRARTALVIEPDDVRVWVSVAHPSCADAVRLSAVPVVPPLVVAPRASRAFVVRSAVGARLRLELAPGRCADEPVTVHVASRAQIAPTSP